MQKSTTYFLSFLFSGLILVSACSKSPGITDRESHNALIAVMDSILVDAKTDPLKYFYANEFRLAYIDSLIQANPGIPQLEYRYAMELQNSRELERSVPILLELADFMRDSVSQRMAHEALAVSYLRMAEVNNCFENYTPSNCILPFDEEAIHKNKEYIKSAIRHLEILLTYFPGDFTHHWMYNIAHIANGTYPGGVGLRHLIPGMQSAEELPDYIQAPFFRDVGMTAGVADNRISGSSCVEDFTGNGHLDIFATSYGFGDQVVFYEGIGNGNFEMRTFSAGLEGVMGGLNIECADLNNSGFADILILRGAWLAQHGEHPNSLLRNNGDGTFTDITLKAGLFEMMPSQVAAFADLNHNGYLDIFIGNESESEWQGFFVEGDTEPRSYPSAIFLNNGDETFTRYQELNGFELDGFVKGAVWGDINNDGWPDLYVSIMGADNRLFVHRGLDENGMPKFEEKARLAGVQLPQFSFPVMMFDVNNNGLEDILVVTYDVRGIRLVATEIARERLGMQTVTENSKLFLNMGNETFRDVTAATGLNTVMFGMGANYGDLNNNGFQDIYIATGAPDLTSIVPNRLFLNHNGERFYESTAYSGVGHLQKGHGISFADFNENGLLDIYAVMGGAVEGDFYHNVLFENQRSFGNWILLKLEGTRANRQAIGARVEVQFEENGTQRSVYRTVSTGGSFGANNSRIHVGLGSAESIERIIIRWPGTGHTQIITNPEINKFHKIREEG
jgi:hypothetical protein